MGEVRAPYWENPISGQPDLITMYEIIKNLRESLYSALLRVILDRGEALLKKHTLDKNKTQSVPLPWQPMSHISES